MIDIKLIDGFWVIGTNQWHINLYTKEQAEKFSSTLIGCENCINCSYCRYCNDCSDCSDCRSCRDCSYCRDCLNCNSCRSCRSCSDCRSCRDCSDCRSCSYCSYCRDCLNCNSCRSCRSCSDCRSCRDCSDCRSCSDCSNCSSCSSCSNFKTNPQRITSSNLGSRNLQTTFYWNKENEQVICGCFKGTLEEFDKQVKITHGDNDFAKGYCKWIELVKMYKGGQL